MTEELSLLTLEGKTEQEIFDYVKGKLLSQGRSSSVSDPENSCRVVCKYRSGVLRCAIGHLIPDAVYNPSMEGRNFAKLVVEFPQYFTQLSQSQYDLLNQLQMAHDNISPDEDFKLQLSANLEKVADRFNLTWSD